MLQTPGGSINDPEIDAIMTTLNEQYDSRTAFIAVLAAFDRGYSYAQIRAASLGQQLEPNGRVVVGNSVQEPEGSPVGILELSELEAKRFRFASKTFNFSTCWNKKPGQGKYRKRVV